MKTTLNNYKKFGNIINAIYRIANPKQSLYIGKFSHISRLKEYLTDRCKSQPKLYRSLIKYGIENHTIEILTHNQKEENLAKYEMAFIRHYDTYNNGLNCTLGGDGKYKYTDEFCLELWKLNKTGMNFEEIGRKFNIAGETIKRLIYRTGNIPIKHKYIISEKTKEKISLKNKGKNFSINTQLKKGHKSNLGKKHKEETKLKMSLSRKHVNKIEIPTVAQDENGVYQLVYSHAFLNYKLSPWHTACKQLARRNYNNENK